MSKIKATIIAIACVAAVCAFCIPYSVQAQPVITGENTLNIDGRLQMKGSIEGVDDPTMGKDDERVYLFLSQARIGLNGVFKDVDYNVSWRLGGEEVPERNSVMSLLDAYVNLPFVEDTFELKAGQFKVPYGRERLQDSGALLFADRSIANNFFNIGRDVGGAFHTKQGSFVAALGVFTGGGPNIPERYIPEDLGVPMIVLRAGINAGMDEDIFTPNGGEGDDDLKFAAYINGMYNRDSRVGHSTPLLVKYEDKALILDGNWNPYIGARGEQAEYWQYGTDVAMQMSVCDNAALRLSAELNSTGFENDAGSLSQWGSILTIEYLAADWALGLRYARVDPDTDMMYVAENDEGVDVNYQIMRSPIHEIAPSFTYFMKEGSVKIVTEVAVQLDVPVSVENGNGVYNLMRQPDQVSYVANGGVESQDNFLASVVVQYEF